MKKSYHLLPFYLLSSIKVPTQLSQVVISSLFTTSSSKSNLQSSDKNLCLSPTIIQDKHLLRRTTNATPSSTGLVILDMIDSGSLEPSYDIYSGLVKSCTNAKKLDLARIIHEHFIGSKFEGDVFFHNSIVNMYAKCGGTEDARRVFDGMSVRDVVTWTAMISGYVQDNKYAESLDLFIAMIKSDVLPNQFTFASVLKAAGGVKCEDVGRQIHAFSVKCGCNLDVYVASSLLDMYAKCEKMDEACFVFDGLENRNEVSWNALIAGFERSHEAENAVRTFWKMQRENVVATAFTYSSTLGACAGIGSLEHGKWVHVHMIKTGHQMTTFVGNTLLDMYAKSGSIEDAKKVFERLDKRDIVSWNCILKAYAQHGHGREAVQMFKIMRKCGIVPNGITFICVLTACSHSGLVEDGKKLFGLMKECNVKADIQHYVTIVDLLGRAGLLDQAEAFIKDMPIRPTSAVWGALLGACRMHKNAEMGKYAAEHIFKLDPCDSGPHILLSNIYASTGRWSEAAKARKVMKESGVKKEPACSWVEIASNVHVFVADDDSHPQRKEIYNMWETISEKIREVGYLPDTSHVLLYLDEKEKETKLQCHSEKLALAFALLKVPSGAPIRIKKNIRMCGDCHSAFKFVSKLTDRVIIVRDNKRFHHFNRGSCSCTDYW